MQKRKFLQDSLQSCENRHTVTAYIGIRRQPGALISQASVTISIKVSKITMTQFLEQSPVEIFVITHSMMFGEN